MAVHQEKLTRDVDPKVCSGFIITCLQLAEVSQTSIHDCGFEQMDKPTRVHVDLIDSFHMQPVTAGSIIAGNGCTADAVTPVDYGRNLEFCLGAGYSSLTLCE